MKSLLGTDLAKSGWIERHSCFLKRFVHSLALLGYALKHHRLAGRSGSNRETDGIFEATAAPPLAYIDRLVAC